MQNCCEVNMDGKTIIDSKLQNPQVIGGKLLGTEIGKSCSGETVTSETPIATCKDLVAATDTVKADLTALEKKVDDNIKDVDERLTTIQTNVDKVEDNVLTLSKTVDANKTSTDKAIADLQAKVDANSVTAQTVAEEIKSSVQTLDKKVDANKTDADTKITSVGNSVTALEAKHKADMDAVDQSIKRVGDDAKEYTDTAVRDIQESYQRKLKDSLGNFLEGGSQVTTATEHNELKEQVSAISGKLERKQPMLQNRLGGELIEGTKVALASDLEDSQTQMNAKQDKLTISSTEVPASSDGALPTTMVGGHDLLLGKPSAYLTVKINGKDYLIPAYEVNG